jgi:hypothetical protein
MNILERTSKAARGIFAAVTSKAALEINGPADYSKLPYGFFRVRRAEGREFLGYNDPPYVFTEFDEKGNAHQREVASTFGFKFEVPEMLTIGGRTVKLDMRRSALPLVRLNYRVLPAGTARLGDYTVFDTEAQRGVWDGDTAWDGTKPQVPEGWS